MNDKLLKQLSKKTQEAIIKVEDILADEPLGLSLGELQTKAKMSSSAVKNTLEIMDNVAYKNGMYILLDNENETPEEEEVSQVISSEKKKVKRNKPFTPNPIRGYEVQKGKAKIFLERRACSKTLTLTIEHLEELTNAVKKAERY
ncbi:hypothetical protein [Psychrobacter sp. I-STPA10]|uniref:hypothetical protein n=1 Tax=Psychrobacter sp. I-STPA10 TaxID=2585769 RepID=UPI001E63EF05|nr:hypothetical protein [Psychrobacter sp. I-STPA10]